MIPIYRKLRKKMAEDNKPMKYMRYALGEILLVVIGILIALQINNWNENRKLQAQEFEILKAIQSDLINCKLEIDRAYESNIILGKRLRKIAMYINEDLPYNSELDTAFSTISNWFSPYFSNSSYETLKIKGVNLIRNKEIRENIVNVYEHSFPFISEDLDQFTWVYAKSVSLPLTNKCITKNLTNGLAHPNDFEQLKGNNEFKNMLNYLIYDKENASRVFSHFNASLDTLLQDIKIELYSKNKI